METLKELAEFYYGNKIFVFPNQVSFAWENWRNKEQTLAEVNSFDWKAARQMYGVAGKKGIRVVKLMGIGDLTLDKLYHLIKTSLLILRLPEDYPWIIITSESVSVVVESADDIQGMDNRSYSGREDLGIKHVILLWQADFLLPSFDSRVRFLGDFPHERPKHVINGNVFKCLDVFRKSNCIEDTKHIMEALSI